MKGYKAFNKGLICRGKQYAENTTFEEQNAEICKTGMHFCKEPLDVLRYYPLVDEHGNINEFATVESDEEITSDIKCCTSKLKIGCKISFRELVKASVNLEHITNKQSENQNNARIGSSGYEARIGSSGYKAAIGSSGNEAAIGSSGDRAAIGSSGDRAAIGSSGYGARIESIGKNSVICCAGNNSIVKAAKGSWITLSEWGDNESGEYIPICVKTRKVDGKHIKANTFYKLEQGNFIEVK